MPRQTFERELQDLQDDLLSLGSMVEKALLDADRRPAGLRAWGEVNMKTFLTVTRCT